MVVAEVMNSRNDVRQWVVAGVDPKGELRETFALPMETINRSRIEMVAGEAVVAGTAARSGRTAVYALDTEHMDRFTPPGDGRSRR